MSNQKRLSYLMFGLLYFAQGTVLSYFTALNAIYFLSRGLTMGDVGIFASIALIPFVIKIFLGMLSDKVNLFGLGHRKPYIVIGLVVQALCLIAAPFIDPAGAYWGFVALAFILQMAMALYDTCTDGLALDTIPEEEQGTIQSFMVGGRSLGVVITASIVGLLAENVSWLAVFWLLAVFTLLPLPMVLRLREAARTVEREFDWGAFRAFKHGPVIALAGLGFVIFFIIAGANQMVNPFLETEFGIALSTAGLITTVWGVGAVLGGASGGLFINRFGGRNAILTALGVTFVAVLALALTPSTLLAWPVVLIFGLAYGVCQTLYYALSMNYTDPRIAASMFSILMAVTNVAQGAGMTIGGGLTDRIGFRWTFAIIAVVNVFALPLLPVVFQRRAQAGD
jgi:PAT family beta-lactamase induction signal transducer AmpG